MVLATNPNRPCRTATVPPSRMRGRNSPAADGRDSPIFPPAVQNLPDIAGNVLLRISRIVFRIKPFSRIVAGQGRLGRKLVQQDAEDDQPRVSPILQSQQAIRMQPVLARRTRRLLENSTRVLITDGSGIE